MMIKDFKPGVEIYAAGLDAMPFSALVDNRNLQAKGKNNADSAKPVYWLVSCRKAGIHPGLSSEQIAHMSQDLTADMTETLKLYPIELKPFEENIKSDLKGKR